ncbi:MAG: hypothetical protein L3I99_05435 [Sulfurimonas sp.]|nr:hypothetical protein [Sulfurimonas sp.]
MNRSTFALLVALLIHLLFLLVFWILGSIEIKPNIEPKKENKIIISLKEMPKKYIKSGESKKKPVNSKIAPPMPKGSQLTHLTKTPKIQKTVLNKPVKSTKPQPKIQPKIKPIPQKPYISLLNENNITNKVEKTKKKSALYSILLEDKSEYEKKIKKKKIDNGSSINQNIKELYGSKFGELSDGQQKYILDNQEIMRRITQQVLTRVASVNLPRDLNINKSNIIEFYLHPNGNISDFKFLRKSGFYILDDTTKETIVYAYSRYPRPTEKTLIRYNVFYNLARY